MLLLALVKKPSHLLKCKAEAARLEGKEVLCALMIDEIAIKKHIEWDGEKMVGYVDIGTDTVDGSVPIATEALVVMVVCVNGSWKVSIGYFLINGMTGAERANLIQLSLYLLMLGSVISLICDGPSCHMSMLRTLGAS